MSPPAPSGARLPRRRPRPVTAAVVLIHANGLFAAGLGVLILLSRYDVRSDDVLRVSLAGAAVARMMLHARLLVGAR